MEFQKATGFLKNAYYQGHGRYVNQIMRCTLKFCKSAGASREARKFIETRLVDVARKNPGVVIYVKPRLFKTPVFRAEYLNGEKHYLNLFRMSCDQIDSWMNWYITRNGQELYKLHRNITTYNTSVQGMWSPFTFRSQENNLKEFPDEEMGRHIPNSPSATDQILELAKQAKQQQIHES